MRIAVWLIHGTWARQARWTRADSRLRKALEEGLVGDVTFRTLPWTGRNNTLDRLGAAEQLIATLKKAEGFDATFVVAHSHGGNIAADAVFAHTSLGYLNEDKATGLADGIVTLNTPFLTPIPRDWGLVFMHLALLGLCVTFLLPHVLRLSTLIESLIVLGLIGAQVLAGIWFTKYFEQWVPALSAPLVASEPFRRHDDAILSICTPDDEAFGWLDAFDSALNAPYLLIHKVALPLTIIGIAAAHYVFRWDFLYLDLMVQTWSPDLGSYLATYLLERPPTLTSAQVDGLSAWLYQRPTGQLLKMLFLSVIGYFLIFWTVLALGAFVITYLFRAIVFGDGFGITAVIRAIAARLKVSLVPMFHQNVEFVIAQSDTWSWLRHSDIYENPLVLRHMVTWMNGRLELRHDDMTPS